MSNVRWNIQFEDRPTRHGRGYWAYAVSGYSDKAVCIGTGMTEIEALNDAQSVIDNARDQLEQKS